MSSATRYERQRHAFPDQRRLETTVVEIGGHSSPLVSWLMKIFLAAAGIDFASDFQGASASNWALGFHPQAAAKVNPEVGVNFIELETIRHDVDHCIASKAHPLLVVHMNDTSYTHEALMRLAIDFPLLPVLTVFACPSGVLALRQFGPMNALEILHELPGTRQVVRPGAIELSAMLAGAIVYEAMMGSLQPALGSDLATVVFYYSQKDPYRATLKAGDSINDLVAAISRPVPGKLASFSNRDLHIVGAGGLGCMVAPLVALDGNVSLTSYDTDFVAPTNLNRQWLYTGHVGEEKAPALCAELAGLASGVFRPQVKAVNGGGDLVGCREDSILIAVPDNDATRLEVSRAARDRGLWFGTAGTGATAGQIQIVEPDQGGCFECQGGAELRRAGTAAAPGAQSCALVANDAIVATNAILGAALVAELRLGLSGIPCRNVRFAGAATGNRLGRAAAIRGSKCEHVAARAASPAR